MKKIKHIARLIYNFIFTNKTRWLTIRVLVLAAWYRMRILTVPMKKLEPDFGERDKESPAQDTFENTKNAYWIGYRVERVCNKTPWESKCLVRALVAQHILYKKGIHTTLYLGVENSTGKMTAHAWLRCGTIYVTGGDGGNNVMVAKFYK